MEIWDLQLRHLIWRQQSMLRMRDVKKCLRASEKISFLPVFVSAVASIELRNLVLYFPCCVLQEIVVSAKHWVGCPNTRVFKEYGLSIWCLRARAFVKFLQKKTLKAGYLQKKGHLHIWCPMAHICFDEMSSYRDKKKLLFKKHGFWCLRARAFFFF